MVGEIELMDFDLRKNYKYHYGEDEKVVIDNIRIKYYGSLPCEYYSNDKYRKITNVKNVFTKSTCLGCLLYRR